MIYLVLAICANVLVSVLLKVAKTKSLTAEVMVLFNYVSASLLTALFFRPNLINLGEIKISFLFLILGILLPSGFIVMARSVEFAGIARSDAAARLSLFFPIIASFTFLGDSLSLSKALAIITAFVAIFCLVYRKDMGENRGGMIYLVLVWFIYGVCDILFKLIAKQGSQFSATLFVAFVLSFILLSIYLVVKKVKFSKNSMFLGLILGVLNFLNIIFYIKAHQILKDSPSLVFASMNIGVICVGLIVGNFIFKESLNRLNFIGTGLGILAICMLVGLKWL